MRLNHFSKFSSIFIISALFLSGCAISDSGPTCPPCPNPGAWSGCTADGVKSRNSYFCGADTAYNCESQKEERTCATQINLRGEKGILQVMIAPTLDENVKGIIKIEAESVPEGTQSMKLILAPYDVEIGRNMDISKVKIITDGSGSDGWKAFIDTTKVKNGLYQLLIGSTYEGAPDENPWLDSVLTQLVVNN